MKKVLEGLLDVVCCLVGRYGHVAAKVERGSNEVAVWTLKAVVVVVVVLLLLLLLGLREGSGEGEARMEKVLEGAEKWLVVGDSRDGLWWMRTAVVVSRVGFEVCIVVTDVSVESEGELGRVRPGWVRGQYCSSRCQCGE